MDDTERQQYADFLSIAVESIHAGSNDVAIDFIEDVESDLEDESRKAFLRGAVQTIEEDDSQDAVSIVEQVRAELIEEMDDI